MMDSACDACAKCWPPEENKIIELTTSTLYLHTDQFFKGWCVLVFKRHVTELFQLPDKERNILMQEVSQVAQALTQAFAALKINYALFGNLLPHMHWHIIPRLADDPEPQQAVFSIAHTPVQLSAAALKERIELIKENIDYAS